MLGTGLACATVKGASQTSLTGQDSSYLQVQVGEGNLAGQQPEHSLQPCLLSLPASNFTSAFIRAASSLVGPPGHHFWWHLVTVAVSVSVSWPGAKAAKHLTAQSRRLSPLLLLRPDCVQRPRVPCHGGMPSRAVCTRPPAEAGVCRRAHTVRAWKARLGGVGGSSALH